MSVLGLTVACILANDDIVGRKRVESRWTTEGGGVVVDPREAVDTFWVTARTQSALFIDSYFGGGGAERAFRMSSA